ncbi:MAG TPA: NusG domain II-containing protein [Ruminiclostridium sp.]
MLKKGDVILLVVVVFCVMAGLALRNDSSFNSLTSWNNLSSKSNKDEIIAIVKKDDVIIKTIDLSKIEEREIIKISGQYSVTIVAEYNRICFLDSTCHDKICVKAGWLSKSGDLAVCLPNRTIIKIQQKNKTDLDGVVR